MKHKQVRGEQGMVAIMISMFLMIILTLMTVGFARLMRREQRQALDNSLTTQAYYAAESGINDAILAIRTQSSSYTKTTCAPDGVINNTVVNASLAVSYPCVLVDQSPTTLEYNNGSIGTDRSTVVPLKAPIGKKLEKIQIAWSTNSASSSYVNCSSPQSLPSAASWVATTGMLRLDVVPADGNLTRDGLINSALNLYLVPCASGSTGSISYANHFGAGQQGQIIQVKCQGGQPRACTLDINFTGVEQQNSLYLRMKSIYAASNMTITGYDSVTHAAVKLAGAQYKIDSTGKVNDVVRRLQVRIPIKQYPVAEFVVQSMDGICKQLEVSPTDTTGFGVGYTCTP